MVIREAQLLVQAGQYVMYATKNTAVLTLITMQGLLKFGIRKTPPTRKTVIRVTFTAKAAARNYLAEQS